MICEKYNQLNHVEKVIFLGELCHAVQSDNEIFELAENIRVLARRKGLFKNVIIIPNVNNIERIHN